MNDLSSSDIAHVSRLHKKKHHRLEKSQKISLENTAIAIDQEVEGSCGQSQRQVRWKRMDLLPEATNLVKDAAYARDLALKHASGINAPANQGQFQFNFKSDEEYLKSRSIKLSIRGLHEVDVGLTPDLIKSYVTEAVKKKKP